MIRKEYLKKFIAVSQDVHFQEAPGILAFWLHILVYENFWWKMVITERWCCCCNYLSGMSHIQQLSESD
jgi:hypothetical protein